MRPWSVAALTAGFGGAFGLGSCSESPEPRSQLARSGSSPQVLGDPLVRTTRCEGDPWPIQTAASGTPGPLGRRFCRMFASGRPENGRELMEPVLFAIRCEGKQVMLTLPEDPYPVPGTDARYSGGNGRMAPNRSPRRNCPVRPGASVIPDHVCD